MRKTLILFILIFLPLNVFAGNLDKTQTRSRGFRVTPRNVEELRTAIESRKENLKRKREGMDESKLPIYTNQDKLRGGVQNLMIMENMLGGIGLEVSDLSMSLNDLSEDSLKYEEEFTKRGKFKKFFFGQKNETKEKFSENIKERADDISKLKQLYDKCSCDKEVKDIFGEQMSEIENEQQRIETYYQGEVKRRGILTWLINIFK